ncbi:MAG TPA: hypothetical protein VFM96_14470 [Gaiellaceae bacterium]|nr:hypothetical protein [Gaiellaceae bacterium]
MSGLHTLWRKLLPTVSFPIPGAFARAYPRYDASGYACDGVAPPVNFRYPPTLKAISGKTTAAIGLLAGNSLRGTIAVVPSSGPAGPANPGAETIGGAQSLVSFAAVGNAQVEIDLTIRASMSTGSGRVAATAVLRELPPGTKTLSTLNVDYDLEQNPAKPATIQLTRDDGLTKDLANPNGTYVDKRTAPQVAVNKGTFVLDLDVFVTSHAENSSVDALITAKV